MPVLSQQLLVLALASGAAAGCVAHKATLERGASGRWGHNRFWPPPPATAVWTSELRAPLTFGDAALSVARTLHDAGYVETRSYPIGVSYAHGFAVVTRLERVQDDGRAADAGRWDALYPEATSLRWLEEAREPELPDAGRYRALLVAFTDLPLGDPQAAPRWNEETWMEDPDVPPMTFHAERVASGRFKVAVFAYEYERHGAAIVGTFVEQGAAPSAEAEVRAAGLGGLAEMGR